MSDNTLKREIDVDKIASENPGINAVRFKRWREKMRRIERLGINCDEPRGPPPPRRTQAIPLEGRPVRSGNLPG